MPRPARMSYLHLQEVEAYGAIVNEALRDGVVDRREQVQLAEEFPRLLYSAERMDESAAISDRVQHGEGIDSPWVQRMLSEMLADRRRIIRPRPTQPEPDGPVAAKKRAA